MRHPAPVMALLNTLRRKNRALRQQVRDQEVLIHSLQLRCDLQERRSARWRRTALELAPKVNARAMDVCLLQVQSEEIEDLPEAKR